MPKECFPDNTALIKSELAKIRIAVASPLPVYLLESWLLHWANHFYLTWKGSTLEEDSEQEYHRNYNQWKRMLENNFVLPFDFELFDHQLTTEEILAIVEIGHNIAIANYRGLELEKILLASQIVKLSIKLAKLHDPPGRGNNVYSVPNGLLSGMRGTSNIGNGFNLTCYHIVKFILAFIL